MRKERLAQFKKKLEEKHRQLVEGVGKTVLYAKGPEDDSTKDLGDQAATSYNREFLFELSNGDRRLLKEVGSALQKLEDGNFGDCERCGEAIAEKRLEALPLRALLHRVPAGDRRRRAHRRGVAPPDSTPGAAARYPSCRCSITSRLWPPRGHRLALAALGHRGARSRLPASLSRLSLDARPGPA